ncbi:MAG: hypothetical protein ACYC9S_01300 [Leptospirales bacterium]
MDSLQAGVVKTASTTNPDRSQATPEKNLFPFFDKRNPPIDRNPVFLSDYILSGANFEPGDRKDCA